MEHKGCMMMQVPPCERHSGGQPGAGICAVCLQEKLTQLWRGEGDSNWKSDTYSTTPPAVQESCETQTQTQTPRGCEPSPPSPSNYYKSSGTPCFPVVFRVRNLQRDDAHESSKSSKGFEREKIDRGYSLGTDGDDDGGDRGHQFSCEIKSIMKELAALHEKKRSEKCVKKRGGSDNGSPLAQRQYQEAHVDVSQVPNRFLSLCLSSGFLTLIDKINSCSSGFPSLHQHIEVQLHQSLDQYSWVLSFRLRWTGF